MKKTAEHHYRTTESKYKGGAKEMYVTYDLPQETRSGRSALYPKVKRVYIAGKVSDWHEGDFAKRTGRKVHGVKIDYEQSRSGYERQAYKVRRGDTTFKVLPLHVGRGTSHFSQIVEVPQKARNIHFYKGNLPRKYQAALQAVR